MPKLLRRNSREAAAAVRAFTDDELDRAAPFSLSYGAPVTAQFVIEDHALRHSWHHLARIRTNLQYCLPRAAKNRGVLYIDRILQRKRLIRRMA